MRDPVAVHEGSALVNVWPHRIRQHEPVILRNPWTKSIPITRQNREHESGAVC